MRSDGTIGIKIIGPGWGSSGYYGREILTRDIPRVFPAGTQMFWNHATATEEAERPEGDLNNLAGVTVSSPYWLESGPAGPGMYADARPFGNYAGAIDEIGEHIGVSIRALGRHSAGEAEGRQGRIIQELVAGKSVDFVTVPGAGGAVVRVFESAGNGRLPAPEIAVFLAEAGRVLSTKNETRLRTALEQLTAVLNLLSADEVEAETPTAEAAHSDTEADMNLEEAQSALAAAGAQLAERDAAIARMSELLILGEAREFVTGRLANADLHQMTVTRLARELVVNPPVVGGRLDEAAYGARVDTAVAEAQAEMAAISGNGQITGQGAAAANTAGIPTLAESRKRTEAALARLGGI